jgi:TetR/AcrR family transcriptional regulator
MNSKPVVPIRERIFNSALREFADRGFSGARLERIATLARTNKRMICYYFKNKEGLFAAILNSAWEQVPEMLEIKPEEILPFWCAFSFRNRDWARMQAWERFDLKNRKIIDEKKRRAYWKKQIEKVDRWRPSRKKCVPISSAYLLLVMIAIENIPVAFPNLVRLLVDKDLSAAQQQEEWLEVCRTLGKFLVGPEDAA